MIYDFFPLRKVPRNKLNAMYVRVSVGQTVCWNKAYQNEKGSWIFVGKKIPGEVKQKLEAEYQRKINESDLRPKQS